MTAPHTGRSGGAIAILTALFSLAALLGLAAAPPVRAAEVAGAGAGAGAGGRAGEINIIATHSGRCLETENSSLQPGAPVLQADCTGQAGAVWRLQESAAGGGSVNVVNANSGSCMEMQNSSGATGTLVRQATCTGQAGTSFLVEDRTTHVWLKPLTSTPAKCLEVAGGSPFPRVSVRLAECTGQSGIAFHQRQPRIGNDPASEPAPPDTGMERLSLTPGGAQITEGIGNIPQHTNSVSANGRYVAFEALSAQLVTGDANGQGDVFVRDRVTGATELVSVSSNGAQGDKGSKAPSISADGRYVAFQSDASTLAPGDTNNATDVFLRDRQTGVTELVSRSGAGQLGSHASAAPSITPDGRHLAFESSAANLVTGDTNGVSDVFLRDLGTGSVERVSVSSSGAQGNGPSVGADVTPDGRQIAFASQAGNLVSGDTGQFFDAFVRDRQSGTTERVSPAHGGGSADRDSGEPAISADGRYVAFSSNAGDLVPNQYNDGLNDVFLRDRQSATTQRVSFGHDGYESLMSSYSPTITDDGRYVAFTSWSETLVPDDTNGSDDAFVWDRQTRTTVRASVNSRYVQGNGFTIATEISANGQYLAFHSSASNLVTGDTNSGYDVFLTPRPRT
ncbi:RICIN domain-containing protein [Streptomyces jumonjinensis]|nr:RICIN domain-containing protein [Streptomyces jumonjinensis]